MFVSPGVTVDYIGEIKRQDELLKEVKNRNGRGYPYLISEQQYNHMKGKSSVITGVYAVKEEIVKDLMEADKKLYMRMLNMEFSCNYNIGFELPNIVDGIPALAAEEVLLPAEYRHIVNERAQNAIKATNNSNGSSQCCVSEWQGGQLRQPSV